MLPLPAGPKARLHKNKAVSLGSEPMVSDIACPLSRMLPTLEGKDWTRYEGVLHTDHAVREEFFVDREIPPTITKPYLMDFTYLYDEGQLDFAEFSGGKQFSDAD